MTRTDRRKAMAIKRQQKTLDLAFNHHRNMHGQPMEFIDHFFMLDILADPSPYTVIMSGVQTGKSEAFICKLLADMEVGLAAFYVLPTQNVRDIFVQNRIDTLLRKVAHYGGQVGAGYGRSDSCRMKHIGKGVVRFGASESMREFKEFPADVLYVDEYDVCDLDGIAFAFDRCKGSEYRFRHFLANPTLPGADFRQNIDWLFRNSDQKRLHYVCPDCGLEQALSWIGNIVETIKDEHGVVIDYRLCDEEWNPTAHRDIAVVCTHCGVEIERTLDCIGWRAEGDPNHECSGYHISRLNVPSELITDLHSSFLAARGNNSKLQVFWNSDLGLAYEGGAGDRITEDLINQCTDPYELPHSVAGPCTAGIDVGLFYDVRISDLHPQADEYSRTIMRRRLVYVGRLQSMDAVIQKLKQYHVIVATIDALPELHKAKEFQGKVKFCRVWRCSYHPTEGANPRNLRWDEKQKVVWIDRTFAMDAIYGCFVSRAEIIPAAYGTLLNGHWKAHMMAPVRAEDAKTGRYYWIKAVDHQFHADVYDWISTQDPQAGFGITVDSVLRGTPRDLRRHYTPDGQEPANRLDRTLPLRNVKRKMPTWRDITG